MTKNNLIFVIPLYNEENVIFQSFRNLDDAFSDLDRLYLAVNDKSTDSSLECLLKISKIIPIQVINNEVNLGHGQSLMKGIDAAIEKCPEFVITLDGDGHFQGKEVRTLFDFIRESASVEIVEGVRTGRKESFFRKPVSLITRLLVLIKTRCKVDDANTPLRVYRTNTLKEIYKNIPRDTIVPNLHISIESRNLRKIIEQKEVSWQNLKGRDVSSTWKQERIFLPPKSFVVFCLNAIKEFF